MPIIVIAFFFEAIPAIHSPERSERAEFLFLNFYLYEAIFSFLKKKAKGCNFYQG